MTTFTMAFESVPDSELSSFSAAATYRFPRSLAMRRVRRWARLIAEVFEVDPRRCPGGRTTGVIALFFDPAVIRKIPEHRPRTELRAAAR